MQTLGTLVSFSEPHLEMGMWEWWWGPEGVERGGVHSWAVLALRLQF